MTFVDVDLFKKVKFKRRDEPSDDFSRINV